MADAEGARTTQGADPATHSWAMLRRQKQVRPMLAADGLSALGDAVFWVGLLVWLLDQTDGTALIALAAVARLGPRALFGAAGGVVADRFDRRTLLVGLDLARAALMATMVWLVGVGTSPASIIVLVFVTYLLATPYRPAFTAGIPFVVGERDAAAANALVRSRAPDRDVSRVRCSVPRSCGCSRRNGLSRSTRRRSRSRRCCSPASRACAARRLPPQRTTRCQMVVAARSAGGRRRRRAPDRARRHDVADLRVQRAHADSSSCCSCSSRATSSGWVREGVGVLNAAIGVGAIMAIPLIGRTVAADRPTLGVVVSLVLTSVPLALLSVMTRPGAACAVLVAVGVGVVIFEVLAVSLVQRLSRLQVLGRVVRDREHDGERRQAHRLLARTTARRGVLLAEPRCSSPHWWSSSLPRWPYRASSRVSRVAEARRRELEPIVDLLARSRTVRRRITARAGTSCRHAACDARTDRRRRDRRRRSGGQSLRRSGQGAST